MPGDPYGRAADVRVWPVRQGAAIQVTIAAMSNSGFAVGDRVTRVNDGTVGVVTAVGPTDVAVRWEPSGVVQMVMPTLLRPASGEQG